MLPIYLFIVSYIGNSVVININDTDYLIEKSSLELVIPMLSDKVEVIDLSK